MASSVSITFSMPLCAPNFSFKDRQLHKIALGGLSSLSTNRQADCLLPPCSPIGARFSVNQRCCAYLTTHSDYFGELVSCCVNVSSCAQRTMLGYWVGPDIDDGWGLVEASVNHIT